MKVWIPLLLAAQTFLVSGCTSALWDKGTFAHHYRPANPVNLRLFYSGDRKDILVQYDESVDGSRKSRPRCYWLDPNTRRVNQERKPHFVSPTPTGSLIPITVSEAVANPAHTGVNQLCAVAQHDDDFFTLYLGDEQLDPYKLPTYRARSQRIKQVLLTPFALGIDATIVGAVIGCYSAPQLLTALNR